MKALMLGLLLAVMPAAAQEPDVVNVPAGKAVCDKDGPACLLNRGDLIAMQLQQMMDAQRIAQLEQQAKDRDEMIADLQEEIAAGRPRCAEVKKAPVPGLKRTGYR